MVLLGLRNSEESYSGVRVDRSDSRSGNPDIGILIIIGNGLRITLHESDCDG